MRIQREQKGKPRATGPATIISTCDPGDRRLSETPARQLNKPPQGDDTPEGVLAVSELRLHDDLYSLQGKDGLTWIGTTEGQVLRCGAAVVEISCAEITTC